MRRSHASFSYQAGSRKKPRRTIAKVEWHPGELYLLVGFIVTTMARRAENVIAFCTKRGTCAFLVVAPSLLCRFLRPRAKQFDIVRIRLSDIFHALLKGIVS